jgi:hypothetical protein
MKYFKKKKERVLLFENVTENIAENIIIKVAKSY